MSIDLNYFFLSKSRRKENNPKSIYPRCVDSQYPIVFKEKIFDNANGPRKEGCKIIRALLREIHLSMYV